MSLVAGEGCDDVRDTSLALIQLSNTPPPPPRRSSHSTVCTLTAFQRPPEISLLLVTTLVVDEWFPASRRLCLSGLFFLACYTLSASHSERFL